MSKKKPLWEIRWDQAEVIEPCAICGLDTVKAYDFRFDDVWLGTNGSIFCNPSKPEFGNHTPDPESKSWVPEWLTLTPKQ